MRKPRLPLLWEAVRGFFPLAVAGVPKNIHAAPWFHPDFTRRNRAAFCGYRFRIKLFGPLPSFQDHISKLEANRRFVAYCGLQSELLRETRYPYYDRDFLEFVYAIPLEQIVRVGQRRSLMKRALVGIVPSELLNRRRKTFAPPEPKPISSTGWPSLMDIAQYTLGSSLGIIDRDRFAIALEKARYKEIVPIGSLKRTLTLESWLRHLTIRGALTNPTPIETRIDSSTIDANTLEAPTQPKRLASEPSALSFNKERR